MKLRTALMLFTALAFPTDALAGPAIAFIGGLTGAGFAGVVGGLSSTAWLAGSWLANSAFGSLLLNIGLSAILTPRSKSPDTDSARVMTRFTNEPRWQLAGRVAVGGHGGAFGEYDEDKNFWFIVAHGDAEITGPPIYILDGIQVEISDGTDGHVSGDVITDAFCLNDKGNQYEGSGTRLPTFRVWTTSPTAATAYGTLPAAFVAAFGAILPANFLLAGICYTVVRCRWPNEKHLAAAYRWRGGFNIGEPSVNIVGNFNRMYDPRNGAHNVNNPATWTATNGNSAIVRAWYETAPWGNNRPVSEVDWGRVAVAANHSDRVILDRSGNPMPIYRCGVAFPDNKPRNECAADINATFDAFDAYDDQGRWYPVAGAYEAPTLSITDARDIISAETLIIDDGEVPLDGVIVEYISPEHNYTKQPSAPWVNTEYYDGVSEPKFATISILGAQNHTQAVTLAKAIGLRIGATRKAAFEIGVKGILVGSRRTIDLAYDAEFTGVYEVVSPVQGDGALFSFAVVPIAPDRWDLGFGEEGEPPQPSPILDIDNSLEVATGVIVSVVSVATSSGAAVRLDATFAAPVKADRTFVFRYTKTSEAIYQYFITDMDFLRAYSAIVEDGQSYDVSWQTVTAGGRATEWTAPYTLVTTADTVAPPALTSFAAADGVGQSVVSFTTANSSHQNKVVIYRGTTTVFASATQVGPPIVAGANISNSITNTGLAAGTYYFWAIPQNGSGVSGPTSGPDTAVII